MNSQGNILITGATGFTGMHACHHFTKRGFNVTAIARKTVSLPKNVHVEYCELTNKKEIGNLIQKVRPQYVLHLAGQNHVGQSWDDPIASLEINSLATAYLLEAIRQHAPSCKSVIVGSALQFDLNQLSTLSHPYSLSKTLQVLIAQSWASLYHMDVIIAKPSNLIGPGLSNGVCSIFAQRIVKIEENKADPVLEVNNLYDRRDFLDVRDAVRAYETLLIKGKPQETYEVTSGKSKSLDELTETFKALTAIDFNVKSKSSEKLESFVEMTPLKLNDLGWEQELSFSSSLKDILDFYRQK
ncbi:NAD-dependent epimerase/dehydratase family protein [Priestia filamentosa]|uniref:NAD-dependent epimerase/dehydratase family protein n=1 Tax=Priestia filamentosa TaxID=1402861 RepID=UPI0028950263|nr:NAD-dependent epimerase/dehydratase family protein [Priestia filamentosa]MDT3766367.1 NAD-dependent epimerase/dehydratase family protein [Priestia filamentosa]